MWRWNQVALEGEGVAALAQVVQQAGVPGAAVAVCRLRGGDRETAGEGQEPLAGRLESVGASLTTEGGPPPWRAALAAATPRAKALDWELALRAALDPHRLLAPLDLPVSAQPPTLPQP